MKNYRTIVSELTPESEPEDYSAPWNINAALQQRTWLLGQLREIVDKAEDENKLSRREQARFDEIDAEIRKWDAKIAKARIAQGHGPAIADRSADEGVALTGEQRFADWYESRNGSFGIAGDGLSMPDFREFSLGRIAAAMLGRVERGDLSDVEQRALAEGVDASGGFLIPEILSSKVIDRVRNKAQVIAAGALTVPMESDTTNLARLAGGNSANWKSENAAVAESDTTWERVQLKTKTAVVLQRLSQELFEDLSPEGATVIEREIIQALALKLDMAALRGNGTDPEPRGIRNQTGVNIVAFGGANGGTPTNYAFLLDALSAVRDANGDPKAAIYSSRTAKTLDSLADTTGQPLRAPESVAALSKFVSNQIPNNLTIGTSTNCSEAYVGDFSNVLIGMRPAIGMRVKVLSERYADNLQVGLIAWLRADVALAHPELLSVVTGIRP